MNMYFVKMKFSLTQKACLISDFHLEKLNLITSPHLINFKKRAFAHFSSYTFICFHVLIFMGGFVQKIIIASFSQTISVNQFSSIISYDTLNHITNHHITAVTVTNITNLLHSTSPIYL